MKINVFDEEDSHADEAEELAFQKSSQAKSKEPCFNMRKRELYLLEEIEDEILRRREGRKKARLRTRGPYRKAYIGISTEVIKM